MRRLFGILTGALLMVTVPALAHAGQMEKEKKKAAKAMSASGAVTAVTGTSLTVKGKSDEWTFTVDKDTTVTAKGASHKTDAMKAEGKATVITDFVHTGDMVTVSYHDMGATKHAASVKVTGAAPMAKEKKK